MNEPRDLSHDPTPNHPEADPSPGDASPEAPRPEPASPFSPQGVRPATRPGCGKPLAVGCGLFLLLFLAGSLVFAWKAYDVLAWTIEAMGTEVSRRLPESFEAAERERLEQAVTAAAARARSREVNPTALQRLQRGFMGLSGSTELSRDQVMQFIQRLETFAAAGPEDELGPDAPASGAEPGPEGQDPGDSESGGPGPVTV